MGHSQQEKEEKMTQATLALLTFIETSIILVLFIAGLVRRP